MINLSLKYLQTLVFLFTHFVFTNCLAQQSNSYSKDVPKSIFKDSIVKIFFDANAKTLITQDSIQARYYRIINYKDGKISGPVSDYYINGIPYMTGFYKDNNIGKGYENGKFTYYFENGKVFQIRNYENGLLNGDFLEFYPSGLKKASVSFSKGKRYGCEYSWDEKGQITRRAFINDNQVITSIECDTSFIDKELAVVSNIQEPSSKEGVITNSVNNKPIEQNKECEKRNTGNYCFTNSTQKSLLLTLYIEKENTGNSIFVSRFDLVNVKWSTEAMVDPGQTKCFNDIEATTMGIVVRDKRSFNESTINFRDNIKVEKCKSTTYIIR